MTPQKTILLVEDNEDDVFLMRRALQQAGITLPVNLVVDGRQAVDYLAGTGQFSDRVLYPLPSFVFLDLKLPYKSGFEVFSWIRQQPELKDSVVIILTSSPEPRDRAKAQELGACAYLVKPPLPKVLMEVLGETNCPPTLPQ